MNNCDSWEILGNLLFNSWICVVVFGNFPLNIVGLELLRMSVLNYEKVSFGEASIFYIINIYLTVLKNK